LRRYTKEGAVDAAGEKRPFKAVACSIVETVGEDVTPRELEETLRLEYRTKLLNPQCGPPSTIFSLYVRSSSPKALHMVSLTSTINLYVTRLTSPYSRYHILRHSINLALPDLLIRSTGYHHTGHYSVQAGSNAPVRTGLHPPRAV
jgi:hypothetical protein